MDSVKKPPTSIASGFMYVLDVLDPQEGPIAYAWPYISVAHAIDNAVAYSPAFQVLETKVKDALKAVGGKPWRVVTKYDRSRSRTQDSTIYAFVGK